MKTKSIFLLGYIDAHKSDEALKDLFIFSLIFPEDKPNDDTIHIIIDSIGGDYVAVKRLHDALKVCNKHIYTYCVGEASGNSAMIFTAGELRYVSDQAIVRLHQKYEGNANMRELSHMIADDTGMCPDAVLDMIIEGKTLIGTENRIFNIGNCSL